MKVKHESPYRALVNTIATLQPTGKQQAKLLVKAVFEMIADQAFGVAPGGPSVKKFAIPGFGVFEARTRKARVVINPNDGTPLSLPPSEVLCFKASKRLRRNLPVAE